MPRFALREFSRPDYASQIPQPDPRNGIWPRLSEFAAMLNAIPFDKKKEQEGHLGENYGISNDELQEDINEILVKGQDPNDVASDRVLKQNGHKFGTPIELDLLKARAYDPELAASFPFSEAPSDTSDSVQENSTTDTQKSESNLSELNANKRPEASAKRQERANMMNETHKDIPTKLADEGFENQPSFNFDPKVDVPDYSKYDKYKEVPFPYPDDDDTSWLYNGEQYYKPAKY